MFLSYFSRYHEVPIAPAFEKINRLFLEGPGQFKIVDVESSGHTTYP